MDQAIRPFPVRQRCLKTEGALRQAILDDGLHPDLPEGAACLLVGEHILQRDHAPGQFGDCSLSNIDRGEALIKLRQIVGGPAPGFLHACAKMVADAVEPFIQSARKLLLPQRRDFRHLRQAAFQLHKLGFGGAGLTGAQPLLLCPQRALTNREYNQQDEGKDREASEHRQQGQRVILDPHPLRVGQIHHAPPPGGSVADSFRRTNPEHRAFRAGGCAKTPDRAQPFPLTGAAMAKNG